MATKLHNLMSGADLHPNAIDGTTGTELTPASQATYDTRYVRTIGGTVTPTSNSTTTLKVTKADGTTQVFDIDTTNARVGIGTATPSATLSLGASLGDRLAIYESGPNAIYGFGIGSSLLQIFASTSTDRVGIGYGGKSASFVETLTVKGATVGVGVTSPNSVLQVAGPLATAINTAAKTGAYALTATDSTIQADATGATFQVTLPTAASITGRQYSVKRINATNNVTVGCTGAETIDGATTKTLGSQWSALTIQSNGSNWLVISTLGTVS